MVSIKIWPVIILILYSIITFFTPRFGALDSNGTKFFALSILNILTYGLLYFLKESRKDTTVFKKFFIQPIGTLYSLLIVVSLLSFFNAINISESILHFSKVLTIFISAYFISVLIQIEKKGILIVTLVLTILLLVDSVTVFIGISNYIDGILKTISNIKSVYSNKNILASAIFVKMPFALFLYLFKTKWLKLIGLITFLCAITATLFMSTRAFYLGLIVLSVFTFTYLIRNSIITREKKRIVQTFVFVSILLLSFLIFRGVQNNFYPKTGSGYNVGFSERLETANTDDSSARQRLDSWKRSFNLIKEKPLLGVGLGNWKITSLKEENQTKSNYILMYKNHNDFIEITAETGLVGGLLFFSIFVFAFLKFGKQLVFRNDKNDEFGFLVFFGVIAYGVDAFFNFPQDRPEIAILFSLYIGLAIAIDNNREVPNDMMKNMRSAKIYTIISSFSFVLLIMIGIVLGLNFKSLRAQMLLHMEMQKGKLELPADLMLKMYPFFPNLNVIGEPIAVSEARYLVEEKRYDDAIKLLMKDNASPYDARREYFLAQCYYNKGLMDSALVYSKESYNLKPYFLNNIQLLSNLYLKTDKIAEGERLVEDYLNPTNNNPKGWLFGYSYFLTIGKVKKALSFLNSATTNFPKNELLQNQKLYIAYDQFELFNDNYFENALNAFNNQDYEVAIKLFSLIIDSDIECEECRIRRAFCYYSVQEYQLSVEDLTYLVNLGFTQPNIFNLLGVNHYFLGNLNESCKYFEKAKDLGDPEGIRNYKTYCSSNNL